MVFVAEGGIRYSMVNTIELEAALAFAKQSGDDRVMLITQPNAVAHSIYVATPDDFFKERQADPDYNRWGVQSSLKAIPACAKDISDVSSW